MVTDLAALVPWNGPVGCRLVMIKALPLTQEEQKTSQLRTMTTATFDRYNIISPDGLKEAAIKHELYLKSLVSNPNGYEKVTTLR
jgi:hypothetical protein